jgi:hypothetical protein
VQVVQSEDGGGVVEGTDAELEVVDVAGSIPLAALFEVSSC